MKFSKTKFQQIRLAYTFLLPTFIIIGTFQIYPMTRAFILSLWEYSPLAPGGGKFVGLGNFTRLLHDASFWLALKNSVLYLLVVPVIIILSMGLAILVEPKIPFINFFRACYYIPVVTMMVVVALVWKLIFDTDHGVLNHILKQIGLLKNGVPWLTHPKIAFFMVMTVTVWKGLGYYMVIFIVGLRAIPRQMLEASMIDGASWFQTLRHVKIPMLWPSITLVSIISSISALQVFEEIYIMTKGQLNTATLVYQIFDTGLSMEHGGQLEMGYACAMGVVLFILLFIFSFFTIKGMGKFHTT